MRTLTIALTVSAMIAGCTAHQPQSMRNSYVTPSNTEVLQNLEMRRSFNQPVPDATAAVYVASVADHHFRHAASIIAWRDVLGEWRVSQVAMRGPGGLLNVEAELQKSDSRKLSDRESTKLDELLRQSETFSGVVRRSGRTGVGAPVHTMEILTNSNRAVYHWDARLEGHPGAVADIVLGKGKT